MTDNIMTACLGALIPAVTLVAALDAGLVWLRTIGTSGPDDHDCGHS